MSKHKIKKRTALKLQYTKAVEKLLEKRKVMMNNPNIFESELLLNLVSHKVVTWTFVKIFSAYNYAGLLV